MTRQLISYPGSQPIPGFPDLDVSQAELDVANIGSLKYWPGLAEWDVKTGLIMDRMTDKILPSLGSSVPADNFVTLSNGKRGYKVNTVNQALAMSPFNTAGSFTIGCVCDVQVGFGSSSPAESATAVPAPWFIYSDTGGSGAVNVAFGNITVSTAVSAAWPKKLSATKLTALVIIFDRALGRISIRYDGVEMWAFSGDQAKTIALMQELNMGALRVGVTGGGTVATRPMATNAFVAFEEALSGRKLQSLETMLLQAAV